MPEIKISTKQAQAFVSTEQALRTMAQTLMMSDGIPDDATFEGIRGDTLIYSVPASDKVKLAK